MATYPIYSIATYRSLSHDLSRHLSHLFYPIYSTYLEAIAEATAEAADQTYSGVVWT